MDSKKAIEMLDNLIQKSRVEMYKPIQVAEALRLFRFDEKVKADKLETYRIISKDLRDKVTRRLFDKVSTSNSRFQDDIWNSHAVPPDAMVALHELNKTQGDIEEYIYNKVYSKSSLLIDVRKNIFYCKNASDIKKILDVFDSDGFRTSGDRFFEVLVSATLSTLAESSNIKITFQVAKDVIKTNAVSIFQDFASTEKNIGFAKLGHTNAADAGMDAWSNFGLVVSVKNYTLDQTLYSKVLDESPVGSLLIACKSVADDVKELVKDSLGQRSIYIITQDEMLEDLDTILSDSNLRELFKRNFAEHFDREFPMNATIREFMDERGYKIL